MKRILVVLMVSLLMYSCNKSVPSDIIKADKMEKILYDIHVVDGYLSTGIRGDSVKITAASYYNGIYKKFGVDSAIYNKSLKYYYKHPTELSAMYANIQNKVNAEIRVFYVADSLKNAKELRKSELIVERKSDSILVNRGYQYNTSDQILLLPRYKVGYSENFISFDVRKLDKDVDYNSLLNTVEEAKVENKIEIVEPKKIDSLKIDSTKNKIDSLRQNRFRPGSRDMQRLRRNINPENTH